MMIFKFIYNQKLMNGIFLTLLPLIIPSNTILNGVLVFSSLIVVHILSNLSIVAMHKYLESKAYKTSIKLGISVVIPLVLGLVFSVIFKDFSSQIINITCFVAIASMLLNTVLDIKYDKVLDNIKSYLPQLIILSIILIVIALVREVIGIGKILGFALPIVNLKPIGFFSQTAGGLLLLGVIVALYSLLLKNNEEENK